jgi:Dolichyl-phosphate-mannose-protein mannosyltransferase
LPDCLAHVALAGVTALSWLGLGTIVLAPLAVRGDRMLDVLNRIAVGAITFALLTLAVGWARLVYRDVYLPFFVLTASIGLIAALRLARGASLPRVSSWPWWQTALLGLIAFYVVLDAISTCAPISSPDALLYHAADPARFEDAHRIFEIPWNSSSYEPSSVEMLVLNGFLLWDSVQGAFAPLLLGLVALAAVIGATHRLAGRPAALLAGAIFFAQPFMTWEVTSGFIEAGLACMVALAAWNFMRFLEVREPAHLVVVGILAGGAAGMKYLGLIAIAAFVVVAALLATRHLRAVHVLAVAIPAVAVAVPWYVKNAVLTGNPVYPYVFGGLNESALAELADTRAQFGYGRSVVDLLLLPFRLLADAKPFDAGEFISPLFLLFAPLVFLLPSARRPAAVVWGGIVLYLLAWFFATQQARFLVPLMPILAVLAAVGALALAVRGAAGLGVVSVATGAAFATGLVVSSVYAAQFIPVAVGAQERAAFLRKEVSLYDGVEWLNQHLGSHDTVAFDGWTLLYLRVPYVTFGTHGDLLPLNAGPRETKQFVRENGITHLAVLARDKNRIRQAGSIGGQLVARVPVRSITSRTLSKIGPPETMLVYEVGRSN